MRMRQKVHRPLISSRIEEEEEEELIFRESNLGQSEDPNSSYESAPNQVKEIPSEEQVSQTASLQNGCDFKDYLYCLKSARWKTILLLFLSATAQTICIYVSQAILF